MLEYFVHPRSNRTLFERVKHKLLFLSAPVKAQFFPSMVPLIMLSSKKISIQLFRVTLLLLANRLSLHQAHVFFKCLSIAKTSKI